MTFNSKKGTNGPSHVLRFIAVSVAGIFLALSLVSVANRFSASEPSLKGIPLPFSVQGGSTLAGTLYDGGVKNDKLVSVVTFDQGELVETLPQDHLSIALVPESDTISHGARLAGALTAGKKIYGYKYSSYGATAEKAAQVRAEAGQPVPFAELFPGQFFVSDEERAADPFIESFATQNEITFHPLSTVTLDRNARYVFVALDSDTTFTVRGLPTCGNGECGGRMVDVGIAVTDDSRIARVELYVDGVLTETDTQVPYGFQWDTSTAANGPHTLQAVAFDTEGNRGESSTVNVSIEP